MQYRTLGNSGLKISKLTLGTMTFGGEGFMSKLGNTGVDEARRLIDMSIDHGVNLFDTANMYSAGVSEEILGKALKAAPHLKDKVEIVTKCNIVAPLGRHAAARVKWSHPLRREAGKYTSTTTFGSSVVSCRCIIDGKHLNTWKESCRRR